MVWNIPKLTEKLCSQPWTAGTESAKLTTNTPLPLVLGGRGSSLVIGTGVMSRHWRLTLRPVDVSASEISRNQRIRPEGNLAEILAGIELKPEVQAETKLSTRA
jgi:hypothetical protein